MNNTNITNPDELFLEELECPDPFVFLTDEELDSLQRGIFK